MRDGSNKTCHAAQYQRVWEETHSLPRRRNIFVFAGVALIYSSALHCLILARIERKVELRSQNTCQVHSAPARWDLSVHGQWERWRAVLLLSKPGTTMPRGIQHPPLKTFRNIWAALTRPPEIRVGNLKLPICAKQTLQNWRSPAKQVGDVKLRPRQKVFTGCLSEHFYRIHSHSSQKWFFT